MNKGMLAVLGACGLVIVSLTVWVCQITQSLAGLAVLLVLAPFALFGIGVREYSRRAPTPTVYDEFDE